MNQREPNATFNASDWCRCFTSGARNHLQADRSLSFRFEVTA